MALQLPKAAATLRFADLGNASHGALTALPFVPGMNADVFRSQIG
jgi:hypothetical protein